MNILEQIEEAKSRFAAKNEREPEEISITKPALLEVARLEKIAYYPNAVLGIPVVFWSPTSSELKQNGDVPFRFE
jgi:hypothetical protein